MKMWIDDVRPAPDGYNRFCTVHEVIYHLSKTQGRDVELMDIDHDAGDFVACGGDYIKILDWMEHHIDVKFPIHIHSMNPVGVQNMRAIINRNGWREV